MELGKTAEKEFKSTTKEAVSVTKEMIEDFKGKAKDAIQGPIREMKQLGGEDKGGKQ
jgi:hypothetical protein